ncbi:MAG TPA: glycosyl hydrolase-related protein, partial [Candidatus Acidoferrum sp.]|nr:glycosyl hydrolase-related protein [Candidatus Acidoferrum sp.]
EIKVPLTLPPARKWRVYIVPTTHTDIGYTDLQDRVKVRHADNGMLALGWLEQYPFFKWYSETYWQLQALLDLHPDRTDGVFARMREKRMGVSGDYANMLTGLCSSEALNRVTLDSWDLARRGGFEVNSVILDDVPSAICSLPMVLAHSGIKYFIEGVNKDRAPHSVEGLPVPFYWQGPDGSRVLSHIAGGYAMAGRFFNDVQQATQRLPEYLAQHDRPDYPYDAILINGAFSDNRDAQPWLPETVRQWNAEYEYPKLILALPEDYFGYIEKNFSNNIPVLKTDFGGWWEDGAGSSALETALGRRAEERAVTAEMLHSLAAVLGGAAYPKTNFDAVWDNILLYNEHTWGAAGSINEPKSEQTLKQWEVKGGFARQADSESRALLASGLAGLAAMTPASDLVVFNQLAWPRRKALVTTDSAGAVQDAETKRVLPCQPLSEGGSCFVADNLPSIGYRAYRQAALTRPAPNEVQICGNQMENEFYRIAFNPKTSGIQSIYDKEAKRELVDTNSEYALGELIYVTGGEGTYAIHSDLARLPAPKFEYHRQTGTGIQSTVGPVFGELAGTATAERFPRITLRARLYHGLKQLDLIYELDKEETTRKEAVYLAFPFALDARKGGLWLEYPDAITEPLRDQHSSACRDWYSVQRWLAVSDGKATVELSPLDAPLFTIGGMTASTWPRRLTIERGHVFAYLMNNYWHTNYKAEQGGRFVFRYSLTSRAGRFSKQDAVVKGWDMFCPPVAGRGPGADKPLFSSPAKSLVKVGPVGLPLTAIKQAEDNRGFIFRLCDFSGKGGTARLTLPSPAGDVFTCNLVETDARKLEDHGAKVAVPVKPFAPLTLRALFAP